MNPTDTNSKITAEHLSRKAVVYLRQSSLAQVRQNTESQRLQYALTGTAKAYGFQRVEVIDRDLGMSAASGAQVREGFKQLLASIALGEVGIVLSRELSRLSRTDRDWCHLMELCQVFNTLIADAENLYDLNRMDDQLVLGIKGTLSVVELSTLKLRLQQGREAKAKRGELGRCLAPGYVMDAAGQLVKDPDLRIQEAIAMVFKQFSELGSIRQTHLWFHHEQVELPVNKPIGGHMQLVWQLPTASFISDICCTIPFTPERMCMVGDRSRWSSERDHVVTRRQGRARTAEQSSVFIKGHHTGYIDWDTFQRYQNIMRSNGGNFLQDETALAVRRGQGLLTGLLRCGRCGRRMHIRYWGKSGTAARYVCIGDFAIGGRYCLGFGGATVDKRVSAHLLQVISLHGLDASIVAIERSRRSKVVTGERRSVANCSNCNTKPIGRLRNMTRWIPTIVWLRTLSSNAGTASSNPCVLWRVSLKR